MSNHRRVSLFALARNLCFLLSRYLVSSISFTKVTKTYDNDDVTLESSNNSHWTLYTLQAFFFYHIIARWTLIFRVSTSATFDSAYYACTHVRPQMRLGGDQRAHNKSLSLFSLTSLPHSSVSFVFYLHSKHIRCSPFSCCAATVVVRIMRSDIAYLARCVIDDM